MNEYRAYLMGPDGHIRSRARCVLTFNLTRVLNIVGVEPLVRY